MDQKHKWCLLLGHDRHWHTKSLFHRLIVLIPGAPYDKDVAMHIRFPWLHILYSCMKGSFICSPNRSNEKNKLQLRVT